MDAGRLGGEGEGWDAGRLRIGWETGREAGRLGYQEAGAGRLCGWERAWVARTPEAVRLGGWEGSWKPGRLETGGLGDSEVGRENGRQGAPP